MDLAILAVLSLWPLVQGGLVLTRWNSLDGADELAWYGGASIALGIGLALFASRYFDGTYFVTVILSNIAILLSVSMFYTGVRVAEGHEIQFEHLYAPVIIWIAATQTDYMKQSIEARVLLSSALVIAVSLSGVTLFLRRRTMMRWCKFLLGLWIILIVAHLIKMMFAVDISSDIRARKTASAAHILFYFLVIVSSSMMYFYIHARIYGIRTANIFFANLIHSMRRNALHTLAPETRQDSYVWSLRLDAPAFGGHFSNACFVDVATAVAEEISWICPDVHRVTRAGTDRIIWLSAPPSHAGLPDCGALAHRLAAIAQCESGPRVQMSLGASLVGGRPLLIAADEADRRAISFGSQASPGGFPSSLPGR